MNGSRKPPRSVVHHIDHSRPMNEWLEPCAKRRKQSHPTAVMVMNEEVYNDEYVESELDPRVQHHQGLKTHYTYTYEESPTKELTDGEIIYFEEILESPPRKNQRNIHVPRSSHQYSQIPKVPHQIELMADILEPEECPHNLQPMQYEGSSTRHGLDDDLDSIPPILEVHPMTGQMMGHEEHDDMMTTVEVVHELNEDQSFNNYGVGGAVSEYVVDDNQVCDQVNLAFCKYPRQRVQSHHIIEDRKFQINLLLDGINPISDNENLFKPFNGRVFPTPSLFPEMIQNMEFHSPPISYNNKYFTYDLSLSFPDKESDAKYRERLPWMYGLEEMNAEYNDIPEVKYTIDDDGLEVEEEVDVVTTFNYLQHDENGEDPPHLKPVSLPSMKNMRRTTVNSTVAGFESAALICDICDFCYKTKTAFQKHFRYHQEPYAFKTARPQLLCPIDNCQIKCDSQPTLIEHVRIHHNHPDLNFEYIEFKNKETYNKFISAMEASTVSRYRRTSGKRNANRKSTYYYNCTFSNVKTRKIKEPPMRQRTSKKMKGQCTAFYTMKELNDGRVIFRGCLKHVGHDQNVSKIPLSNSIRYEIVKYLLKGMNEHQIVQLFRSSSNPMDRKYYIQPYEVRNLIQKIDKMRYGDSKLVTLFKKFSRKANKRKRQRELRRYREEFAIKREIETEQDSIPREDSMVNNNQSEAAYEDDNIELLEDQAVAAHEIVNPSEMEVIESYEGSQDEILQDGDNGDEETTVASYLIDGANEEFVDGVPADYYQEVMVEETIETTLEQMEDVKYDYGPPEAVHHETVT